jgi:hypothetical protein
MRFLMNVHMPHEPFNTLVREGTAGATLKRILEDAKPEAVYFTELHGTRTAVMIIDLKDASQIPSFAEPWFLNFDADCEFRVVMSPEDLEKAALDKLGEKWR